MICHRNWRIKGAFFKDRKLFCKDEVLRSGYRPVEPPTHVKLHFSAASASSCNDVWLPLSFNPNVKQLSYANLPPRIRAGFRPLFLYPKIFSFSPIAMRIEVRIRTNGPYCEPLVQKDQHTSRSVWARVDFNFKKNSNNSKKTNGNAGRHN